MMCNIQTRSYTHKLAVSILFLSVQWILFVLNERNDVTKSENLHVKFKNTLKYFNTDNKSKNEIKEEKKCTKVTWNKYVDFVHVLTVS